MLAAKLQLIFGDSIPDDVNLDDEDELAAALRDAPPIVDVEMAELVLTAIARQILRDDPLLVWQTAERLLAQGLDREAVLRQLVLAFLPSVEAALDEDADPVDYEELLRQLPLPTEGDIIAATFATLPATDRLMTIDELDAAVLEELGVSLRSSAVEQLLDTVMDRLLDRDEIALLPGDFVVSTKALCKGIVMTTRRTSEHEWPPMDTDLAGFSFFDEPIDALPAHIEPGQLIAVRDRIEGPLVEPVQDIAVSEAEITQIRRAYQAEEGEAGLPVPFSDLVINLLASEDGFFDQPKAPLSELVRAAGLQVRGSLIAGDESVWRRNRRTNALFRILDLTDDDEAMQQSALEVLKAFEAVAESEPVTTAELRHVLDLLIDVKLLMLMGDQLFQDADPGAVADATTFAQRLTSAASRPLQRGVAGWLTARAAELRGDPIAAAQTLTETVHAAPDFVLGIERLAWTRSDQGRAAEAAALLRLLDWPDNPDLVVLESVLAAPANTAAAGLRRNDPCWCGSGRKYKVCHLRVTALPPLPERMTWLLRKMNSYLDHRGEPVTSIIDNAAFILADEDEDNVDAAFDDPLLRDVVLVELGWFDRFLVERGALLPEDEQLLFASWQLIARTLYEVTSVSEDAMVGLRDVRTGDEVEVRDRLFSQTAQAGQLLCARAVPDGRGHQIIGGVFGVTPGREQQLMEILDDPDPESLGLHLLAYRAAMSRPPTLQTTEGEPLVPRAVTLEVTDSAAARKVLDKLYHRIAAGRWHQNKPGEDPPVVRASLELKRSTLTVEAMSNERMDRVLAELSEALPDARVVSDEVFPVGEGPVSEPTGPAEPLAPEMREALTQFIAQMEERWCQEPVPALGGLTPQECAADPTRRESVIRLIDSFPEEPPGGIAMSMRPQRLRELLGLR